MAHNTILVPLDGSDYSKQILPVIRKFFPPAANRLVLLRVVAQPDLVPADAVWMTAGHVATPFYISHRAVATPHEWREIVAEVRDELKGDITALEAAGYSVSLAVQLGEPLNQIETIIKQERIDLVAMATHARTGLNRFVFGSVAQDAIHRLPVPMLLVHPEA